MKSNDETGSHEDCHRRGRPRVTSDAEDKFIELTSPQIAAQINASQSSSNRHISTSTVQRRLRESGLHGIELLQRNLYQRTPIIRRDLLGPRNTSNGH